MNSIKRHRLPVNEYIEGIIDQNRFILSRAITLIESHLPSDEYIANQVMEGIMKYTGNSIRIGITGIPGVGKSTFIECFGEYITSLNKNVAVLAIDPSSERSRGSIMGDKTRMEHLANNARAFIRPSPTGNTIGGVAKKTRESMLLCEAAGFDVILIETVGVGQSETTVKNMVDFFLLLMLAGAGDELQGIKKGIMEMADAIAITKADGDNAIKAKLAQRDFQNALHLFKIEASGWSPKVITCSALEKQNIDVVFNLILAFEVLLKRSSYFQENRIQQQLHWMHENIKDTLVRDFYAQENIQKSLKLMEENIKKGEIAPYVAAKKLMNEFYHRS